MRTKRPPRHRIYRNLRDDCWSVRLHGKVIAHADSLAVRGVEFSVSEPGRQRVLRERRKNVHTFVVGHVDWEVDEETIEATILVRPRTLVYYDPYKGPHFVTAWSNEPVYSARYVVLSKHGEVWAYEPMGVKVPCG